MVGWKINAPFSTKKAISKTRSWVEI